jgi:histidinol-phosphate phosphatase family protein
VSAAVFLDRDGTIIRDAEYLADPRGIELLPGAAEGLARLAGAGFRLVVVTNQSGVARGLFPESAIDDVNRELARILALRGVEVAGWYHCPHLPEAPVAAYARECQCRKPAPGLILRAAGELSIDLARSYAVGDRPRDVEAGRRAGVRGTVLLGEEAPDLEVAARLILERSAGA